MAREDDRTFGGWPSHRVGGLVLLLIGAVLADLITDRLTCAGTGRTLFTKTAAALATFAARLDDADRMERFAVAVPVAAMVIIGRTPIAEEPQHRVVKDARSRLVSNRQVDVVDKPAHVYVNAPMTAKMPDAVRNGQPICLPRV